MDINTEASVAVADHADDNSSAPDATGSEGSSLDNLEALASSGESHEPKAQPAPEQQYQPNWKYKANGDEYEIDEEYRGYVKGPEDEKRIKRLFEQFKGVDKLKNEYQTTKQRAQEYEGKYNNYEQSIQAINRLVATGQEKKALEILGFKPQQIYKAAQEFLEFDELPQQAKAQHAYAKEQEALAAQFYQEKQQLEQERLSLRTEKLQNDLQRTLAQPEITQISKMYDQAKGEGEFFKAVRQAGQMLARVNGQDPTAAEAVEYVAGNLRPFVQQAQQFQAQPQAQAAPGPQAPKPVPVIPATSGNMTPVKKRVTSIDDIEKEYRNL